MREIFAKVKSILWNKANGIVIYHLASSVEIFCEMGGSEEK